MCERWNTFDNFYADMGDRPPGTTLGRINNNGNYEPGNCRWEDAYQQCNNRTSNRFITCNGKTLTISQWARELGMDKTTIKKRLDKGWPIVKVLSKTRY